METELLNTIKILPLKQNLKMDDSEETLPWVDIKSYLIKLKNIFTEQVLF